MNTIHKRKPFMTAADVSFFVIGVSMSTAGLEPTQWQTWAIFIAALVISVRDPDARAEK